MKSPRKNLTLFVAPALFMCAAFSTFSNAADIAEITESIGANIGTENWDVVDQGYTELYGAYQEEYGVGSGQALAMAKVLGEWKIQAYRDGRLSEDASDTIASASSFYTDLIEQATAQYGAQAEQLIDPLYGQAMVNYHLFQLAAVKPINSYAGIGSETIMERQCVSLEGPGSGEEGCDYIEIPSQDYIQSQRFAKNQETLGHWEEIGTALHQIVEISEVNRYTQDQAQALVHLGDYHFFREENDQAIEFYSAAYQLVLRTSDAESMQGLFASPTIVPALSLSFPGLSSGLLSNPELVLAFDIKADGSASNIEVVGGSNSTNSNMRDNAIDFVSGSTFRPQFDENGVLQTKRVEMHF